MPEIQPQIVYTPEDMLTVSLNLNEKFESEVADSEASERMKSHKQRHIELLNTEEGIEVEQVGDNIE